MGRVLNQCTMFYIVVLFVCLFVDFLSLPHHTAFGIFVLQPGIKPMLPEVEVWSLNHWTTKEVSNALIFDLWILRQLPAVHILMSQLRICISRHSPEKNNQNTCAGISPACFIRLVLSLSLYLFLNFAIMEFDKHQLISEKLAVLTSSKGTLLDPRTTISNFQNN